MQSKGDNCDTYEMTKDLFLFFDPLTCASGLLFSALLSEMDGLAAVIALLSSDPYVGERCTSLFMTDSYLVLVGDSAEQRTE